MKGLQQQAAGLDSEKPTSEADRSEINMASPENKKVSLPITEDNLLS